RWARSTRADRAGSAVRLQLGRHGARNRSRLFGSVRGDLGLAASGASERASAGAPTRREFGHHRFRAAARTFGGSERPRVCVRPAAGRTAAAARPAAGYAAAARTTATARSLMMDRLSHHFATMAYNNAWANHRLLTAVEKLNVAQG